MRAGRARSRRSPAPAAAGSAPSTASVTTAPSSRSSRASPTRGGATRSARCTGTCAATAHGKRGAGRGGAWTTSSPRPRSVSWRATTSTNGASAGSATTRRCGPPSRSTRHDVGVRATPSVLASAFPLTLAAAPAASAAPQLPIGHAGRWMTDAEGRVTILHGLNMVSKRPPYAPDATGFGDDDAAFLASEGYNTVRVGIIYKAVEPAPGVYDDAYLDRIRGTVDALARHGIVSLLDFHQDLYNERFEGEGWPDWAVIDDGLPAEPKNGFPANYLAMPALQRAFDHFWANDSGLQNHYAAAWRRVAERFGSHPAVLGYDLLTEPWPGSTWQQCANPQGCPAFDATMTEFIKRTIAAIRAADPTTLAFYEPNVIFNDGAKTNVGDTGDAHAAMSFHDYCLTSDSGGPTFGCDTLDDMVFANADEHAKATGDALLLTEFGATTDPVVLGGMTDRADRFMVGWQE